MQPRSTSADPSLPSRRRRPSVAVLVERHGSDAVTQWIAALAPVFRCSVHDVAQTVGAELLDDPDLVIWELRSENARRRREAITHSLLDAAPGRPVLFITDRVDAATFDSIGDHITEFVVHPFAGTAPGSPEVHKNQARLAYDVVLERGIGDREDV